MSEMPVDVQHLMAVACCIPPGDPIGLTDSELDAIEDFCGYHDPEMRRRLRWYGFTTPMMMFVGRRIALIPENWRQAA